LVPRDAAPHVDSAVCKRLFRVELLAYGRIDTIAGNGDIPADRSECSPSGGFRQPYRHAALVLLNTLAAAIGHNAIRAQPLRHCVHERDVQPASVNSQIRIWISGVVPSSLAVYELSVAVKKSVLANLDSQLSQLGLQTETGEFTHRMGKQRDSNA